VCDEPWRHLEHKGRLERVPTTRFSTSKSPPIAAQPLVHEFKGQLHANNYEHVSISSVTERASDDDGAAPLAVWPGPGGKLGLGGRGLENKWLSTYNWPCVNLIIRHYLAANLKALLYIIKLSEVSCQFQASHSS
jgi:hypothetical protein